MRELFGKLMELDPTVEQDVFIIEYFDRLSAAGAGIATLLKEAALIARATVGYDSPRRTLRYLASGEPAAGERPKGALSAGAADGRVWIAADQGARRTAPIVLERLAVAIAAAAARGEHDGRVVSAVEILLQAPLPDENPAARGAALGRLRLEADGEFRAVASPLSMPPPASGPHALIQTPVGPAWGTIIRHDVRWRDRGGVGTQQRGRQLHVSWRHALLAMLLSDDRGAFEADSLGLLLAAIDSGIAQDGDLSGPALAELSGVDRAVEAGWAIEDIVALADGESLRTIAVRAGVHHSTIDERARRLCALLGFNPREPLGRHRLAVAALLWKIRDAGTARRAMLG